MERIISAAVRIGEMIFSLPPPARHHDVLHNMSENITPGQGPTWEQGFLTTSGRFVGRREGYVLARWAGQLDHVRPKTEPLVELFSEDLW